MKSWGIGWEEVAHDEAAAGEFQCLKALSFVLENQGMIDKTLLFDIELLKIVD